MLAAMTLYYKYFNSRPTSDSNAKKHMEENRLTPEQINELRRMAQAKFQREQEEQAHANRAAATTKQSNKQPHVRFEEISDEEPAAESEPEPAPPPKPRTRSRAKPRGSGKKRKPTAVAAPKPEPEEETDDPNFQRLPSAQPKAEEAVAEEAESEE